MFNDVSDDRKAVRKYVRLTELELNWCKLLDEEDFVKSCPSTKEQIYTFIIIPVSYGVNSIE